MIQLEQALHHQDKAKVEQCLGIFLGKKIEIGETLSRMMV